MHIKKTVGGTSSSVTHYLTYLLRRSEMRLESAMLIVSIDVDVGCRKVGIMNNGKNDLNVNDRLSECYVGKIEEQALPLIVSFFDTIEVPATFGIRGQLLEVDTSIVERLQQSPIPHDIGSHSYHHRDFRALTQNEVEYDLKLVSNAMKKLGGVARSFIFPRNRVAHLGLLEKSGYKCFRGYGDFLNDGMYIRKHDKLFDIHPGFFIGNQTNAFLTKKIVDLAVRSKAPFHVWFHPWNLGNETKSVDRCISRLLLPIFKHAKSKEKDGLLRFKTMVSAAEEIESGRLMNSDG